MDQRCVAGYRQGTGRGCAHLLTNKFWQFKILQCIIKHTCNVISVTVSINPTGTENWNSEQRALIFICHSFSRYLRVNLMPRTNSSTVKANNYISFNLSLLFSLYKLYDRSFMFCHTLTIPLINFDHSSSHLGFQNLFSFLGLMGLRKWWVVMVVLVLVDIQGYYYAAKAEPQVPCYFIFGDSLVDNGNNNQLSSLARANYLPYGIDFPNGPTGRFSNGKTTVDVIGKLNLIYWKIKAASHQ